MTGNDLLLDIISAYLERYTQSSVSTSQLVPFMERYALEHPEVEAEILSLTRGNLKGLHAALELQEQAGTVQIVRRENSPVSIVCPGFFFHKIRQYYSRIDDKPEHPFPPENMIGVVIPIDQIQSVDIKSDFMQWLNRDEKAGDRILRVNFPDGVASMICSVETLKTRVLVGAVHKIRHYLRDPKNFAYTRQKLTPLLKGKELAVRDLMQSIVTSPDVACTSVLEPTDFSFHLWTQLSSNIIKEYAQKVDKLSEEHGFCQAAYLIGYYNVFYRGIIQRKKEEDLAVNVLLQAMKRPPFAFKISDIYELKDDKGLLLINKLDKEKMNQVIKSRLVPAANKETPEIIRLNTGNDEAYFMLFSSVPQMVSEQLLRAQKEMREFYQHSWTLALKQDFEFTTMHGDQEFLKHVAFRLKSHFPLLDCLLDFKIIVLSSRLDSTQEPYRTELFNLLDAANQKMKSHDLILRINRKRLYDDARMLLPSWMVIPIVKSLVRFFRLLFLGPDLANKPYVTVFDHEGQERVQQAKKRQGGADKKAGKQGGQQLQNEQTEEAAKNTAARQQAQKFRDSAKELEGEFLPPGSNLQFSMEQVLDRWNTLLDQQTKNNLTEDVNSLCRDYLKKMRITSKSKLPTVADIRSYAVKVWETDSLLNIRNRKDLLRYLELYILNLLEKMP